MPAPKKDSGPQYVRSTVGLLVNPLTAKAYDSEPVEDDCQCYWVQSQIEAGLFEVVSKPVAGKAEVEKSQD